MQTAMSKRKLRVGTQCTSLHCNVMTLMVSCGTLHVPAQPCQRVPLGSAVTFATGALRNTYAGLTAAGASRFVDAGS